MKFTLLTSLIILLKSFVLESVENNDYVDSSNNGVKHELDKNMTHILSRKKRFLIFPDGSSLQLVFCLQASSVIPIGDIFLFGSTLALAWELPTDPKFIYMFNNYKKVDGNRRGDDINNIYYLDANGKIRVKVPYKRKKFFNPIFAKRSVTDAKVKLPLKNRAVEINRKRMHDKQLKREFLKKEHMDESSIRFHRTSRVGLFEKLELLFKAFGWDGRQCVLRRLCESGRREAPQGTFMQELMKIVFTLPKGSAIDAKVREEYDSAHSAIEDCDILYPNCPNFDKTNNAQFNNFQYK